MRELGCNRALLCPRPYGALSDDARLTSVYRVHRPVENRKTKIGTGVANVTRDSDTTFKVKRSTCRGWGHIVAASHTAC